MTREEKTQRHLANRAKLMAAAAGEVFGPGSSFDMGDESLLAESTPVDLDKKIVFEKWEDYSSIRPVVMGSGEEIIRDERPSGRYGMGILFPKGDDDILDAERERVAAIEAASIVTATPDEKVTKEEEEARSKQEKAEAKREKESESRSEQTGEAIIGGSPDDGEGGSGEVADLRLTNLRRQRSIGVSFVVDAAAEGDLRIRVTGGRYKRITGVEVKGSHRKITWWARRRVEHIVPISISEIRKKRGALTPRSVEVPVEKGLPGLDLTLEVLVRGRERIPGEDHPESARLLTVTLVNRTDCRDRNLVDEHCLFQGRMEISATNPTILPYPRSRLVGEGEEQRSLDLLYRHEETFATGHGCAGTWNADERTGFASRVFAEVLPSSESPAITPDLVYEAPDGSGPTALRIPVALLADEEQHDEAVAQLKLMVRLYEDWIAEREKEGAELDEPHQFTAKRHVQRCRETLARMKQGIDLLVSDPGSDAVLAFRLTNKAMLLQALASRTKTRVIERDAAAKRVTFMPPYAEPDMESKDAAERAWRPFQIAFLLMNIHSLADPKDPGREIVDLIWFPTGGGKTEAYLACAAFSIFMRRLRDPKDLGTHVLMRYTLRLLTAQQFQRASSLICGMERIRDEMPERLGDDAFTIGIWVGGATTPNSWSAATSSLSKTKRNGEEDYQMILLKCPWCGLAMGPARRPGVGSSYDVHGVRKVGDKIKIHCHDPACRFSDALPVKVVDTDLYENPPTYVIATVDKFASLAWRTDCRSLFGIGKNGDRVASPPGLIIQDELHLITGPLGSMVGLYETLVDELSTDRRDAAHPIKPKLIAATATTRASDQQIRDLYARSQTSIFPAPGLDAADSFFAKYDRDEDGKRKPGRLYVGILPLNYSSTLTASVRVYSAVLAGAFGFKTEEERDPWWTLLVFYNSLRELGGALTLFGADIPERLKNVQRRWYPGQKHRFIGEQLELTGRLTNSEVPRALEALGRNYVEKPSRGMYPVDACLASNIIEVGVDVDRLGMMAVAGQPKTTAQYIQATGRVGRDFPGLILVNYGASKARDRSHYEHFQAYHSRLYAQVEPASVTPFTIPVLDRALHAVMVATVRQTLPEDELGDPSPFLGTSLETAAKRSFELLERRITALAESDDARLRMLADLKECYDRRIREWEAYNPMKWHEYFPKRDSGDQPLIRPYGSPCPPEWVGRSWETPNSLRGVDAECKPHIPFASISDDA
jgi:hypothetical protein